MTRLMSHQHIWWRHLRIPQGATCVISDSNYSNTSCSRENTLVHITRPSKHRTISYQNLIPYVYVLEIFNRAWDHKHRDVLILDFILLTSSNKFNVKIFRHFNKSACYFCSNFLITQNWLSDIFLLVHNLPDIFKEPYLYLWRLIKPVTIPIWLGRFKWKMYQQKTLKEPKSVILGQKYFSIIIELFDECLILLSIFQ